MASWWSGVPKHLQACILVVVIGFGLNGVLTILSDFGHISKDDIFAIYNFGDSNSDTGSNSAVFGRAPYPYGMTFFGKPSGRVCDGRLIIDFIAERFGFSHISAYLDAIEGNFKHGANFAATGSTIHPVDENLYGTGVNPVSLNIQLLQFQQLKERSEEVYKQGIWFSPKALMLRYYLPRPEDFSKALYTFDIGQNDIHYRLKTTMTQDQAYESLHDIINYFSQAIELLYQHQGARRFVIHNTGPLGCLPMVVEASLNKDTRFDDIGCIKSYNEMAKEFNHQLKMKVSELRTKLQDSEFEYVDMYSAKYALIRDAHQYGFIDPLGYCCKDCKKSYIPLWKRQIVNETANFVACDDPSKYISWDGVHYSEAANRWLADRIFDRSLCKDCDPLVIL